MSACCNKLAVLGLTFFGLLLGLARAEIKIGNTTIDRTVQLRTHSLYAPYIDQDLQNRWWDFGGDAYINTNKHVRLTRMEPSEMGWLWSRLPLTASNFVIEVEFKIGGSKSHLYGDGIGVWVTKERAVEGPIFGNGDRFEGLGVMLDTYANSRHSYAFPRVSGVILDGKTPYDYANDGDSQSIGGCSANYRRAKVATKLKITYVKEKLLDVKIQYKGWDEWTDCFQVQNVKLPTAPYIGFTAMTGDVADAHDIISVTSYSAVLSSPNSSRDRLGKPRLPNLNKKGTWTGLFFKAFLAAGVCVGAWYGYKQYKRKQRYTGFGSGFGPGVLGGKSGPFGGLYGDAKRF
ncbi:legume-like lectin [Schizophyllum commune Tattone D]|uniref:Legume-like lectin n=1 Tax=Schizophyllum commune (strain H4-8 / FGSC 9210) TaxID=578458 RepID=D8QA75_SCHCM|nr:legume-like lectin [Schizophyllum commune H4-8]KAI5835423.1 legume-like lectin [Schizophyllum commune Tattone D]KAI5890117.1 legume-like lectin [Schizophyllum commune H4-8]